MSAPADDIIPAAFADKGEGESHAVEHQSVPMLPEVPETQQPKHRSRLGRSRWWQRALSRVGEHLIKNFRVYLKKAA
jgi:hypothetical protein